MKKINNYLLNNFTKLENIIYLQEKFNRIKIDSDNQVEYTNNAA